jgi:hypothetical protein
MGTVVVGHGYLTSVVKFDAAVILVFEGSTPDRLTTLTCAWSSSSSSSSSVIIIYIISAVTSYHSSAINSAYSSPSAYLPVGSPIWIMKPFTTLCMTELL